MWDNYLKNFDVFDYSSVKKNANEFNKKVIKFWNDFFEDVKKSLNN